MEWEMQREAQRRKYLLDKIREVLLKEGVDFSEEILLKIAERSRIVEFEYGGSMISVYVDGVWMDIERGIKKILESGL